MKSIIDKKLVLILALALIVRLVAVNQSLWLDEATTAQVVKQFSFWEIVTKFSPKDFHPPFYYLTMKAWTSLFGYSEFALRMPSIVFSLGVGWLLYLLGGFWAMTLFLFNPLIIYYSQEARMYLMATFLLTAALYFFKNKKWVWFGLFSILSFYTFYGSIFLVVAFFLHLIYKKKYRVILLSGTIFFAGALAVLPLLLSQLTNSKIALAEVTNWSIVLGKANLKNLLLIPVKFAIGRIDFYPKWLYYSIAGLWSAFVWWLVVRNRPKEKLPLFLLICPLVLGFITSFSTPLLQYFRFIYLIPLMSLILAKSAVRKVIVVGFVSFSLVYLLLPQFHREDWRSLSANLPEDKPVYMIFSSADPIKYYRGELKINDLRDLEDGSLQGKIIIIPYTSDVHGVDYKSILTKRQYTLIKKSNFRELVLEEWSL